MTYEITLSWVAVVCWAMLATSFHQTYAAEYETHEIALWTGVAPGSEGFSGTEKREERGENTAWITGVSRPTITVYLPEGSPAENTRSAIVVCPGGGYAGLSIDLEGNDLAKWLCDRGVVAGVLKYRHGGGVHKHPVPLNDAHRALRLMRNHADEWKVAADKVGIAGYSAGGHVASTAGTRWDNGDPQAADPVDRNSCRANFIILAYPVITMHGEAAHSGSKKRILGAPYDGGMLQQLSNELQVTAETGPTFLVHAADDAAVPIENSLLFYEALRRHGVAADLHVYGKGGHGFGMYRNNHPIDAWPDELEKWLKDLQFMP